jgi:hypothetical protein
LVIGQASKLLFETQLKEDELLIESVDKPEVNYVAEFILGYMLVLLEMARCANASCSSDDVWKLLDHH